MWRLRIFKKNWRIEGKGGPRGVDKRGGGGEVGEKGRIRKGEEG